MRLRTESCTFSVQVLVTLVEDNDVGFFVATLISEALVYFKIIVEVLRDVFRHELSQLIRNNLVLGKDKGFLLVAELQSMQGKENDDETLALSRGNLKGREFLVGVLTASCDESLEVIHFKVTSLLLLDHRTCNSKQLVKDFR